LERVEGKVKIIMQRDDAVGLNTEVFDESRYRPARCIHVAVRFRKNQFWPARHESPLSDAGVCFVRRKLRTDSLGEHVERHLTDIVSSCLILWTWISEPNDQPAVTRHGLIALP